uniref:Endo-1,3(4)-beta-glucanase 1-like n=1 Tax=Crassostrea virginica TaxID=6565 RepID=A0A8B8B7M3_CRAVI|nr:endo-1,3(4)-beta-glucanase 1-like [Crassostrea virginica]
MIDFGHGTVLLCQSILNLHPSCYNGGCYCFPGVETNTSTIAITTPSPPTKSSTTKPIATTTTKTNTACSTSSDCTENNTMIDFGHGTSVLCKSLLNLHPYCSNGICQCFPGVETSVLPTTTPSLPTTTTTSTTKLIATTTTKTNAACVSESDCDNSNTFYELFSLRIPCPPGDAQCVNNSCFCNPFLKDNIAPQTAPTTTTTTTKTTTTTTTTTTARTGACSTSSDCTENNTMIDFGHGSVVLCKSVLNLHPYCYNGGCHCFPGVETNTSTIATTTPSLPTTTSTTKPITTTTTKTNTACVSESDCDHSNTFYELYSLRIPCPPGDAQCVNNSCFCNPFKGRPFVRFITPASLIPF